jgi:hypothetical protein
VVTPDILKIDCAVKLTHSDLGMWVWGGYTEKSTHSWTVPGISVSLLSERSSTTSAGSGAAKAVITLCGAHRRLSCRDGGVVEAVVMVVVAAEGGMVLVQNTITKTLVAAC